MDCALKQAVREEHVAERAVRDGAAALRHQPQLIVCQAHAVRIHSLAAQTNLSSDSCCCAYRE